MRIKQVHPPFSTISQCENICSFPPSPSLLTKRWRRSSQYVINISSRLEEGVSRWQVALCVGTLPQRRCFALPVELHHMSLWNHFLFMKATWSKLSFNKGWEMLRRLGESCFHSNPNIAALKSEVQRETGANRPSII